MASKRSGPRSLQLNQLQIDFVILADSAQEVNGKLYLLGGGWNIHHAEQYPSTLQFGAAIGILVPWGETNTKHPTSFSIGPTEEAPLLRGEAQFEVGREVGIRPGMTQRVILAFSGLISLPHEGTYEVVASVAGAEKHITFEALPASKAIAD